MITVQVANKNLVDFTSSNPELSHAYLRALAAINQIELVVYLKYLRRSETLRRWQRRVGAE